VGIGLQGAFANDAMAQQIRQRVIDQLAEKERQRKAGLDERHMQLQEEQQRLLGQQRHDALAEATRNHQASEADRTMKENAALNEQIPPGRSFTPQDPIVGRLQMVGGVQHQDPNLASTELGGFSSLPGAAPMKQGQLVMKGQAAQPERFTKLASAKQLDTTADNERQAQANTQKASDAEARLAESTRYHDLLNKVAEGQLSVAQMRAEMAKWQADAKAAQGPKLPQREDDTVVSIHQMSPLVDELLNKTQARIASRQPQGMLGNIGEKVGRVATKAAYSAGLPVAPQDSERIQLASLLQILGTVPYLRGIRNMQFVNQIQQHLADPSATDESVIERLHTLKRILPGMEQAIYDVHNGGKIPHSHEHMGTPEPAPAAGAVGKPTAAELIKKYGGQ
jgi:hypothetical protein